MTHSYSNYSLIVPVIVYHVPSIDVSVFIWVITLLSRNVILKIIRSCLLMYLFVSEPHALKGSSDAHFPKV